MSTEPKIALQEVKLPEDTSAWLAEQLSMPYVYLVPQTSNTEQQAHDGIAILSRHPFVEQKMLAFHGQQRVVQYVQVRLDGQPLVFCNGHYYWYPGSHPQRDIQVQQVLDWLGRLPSDLPIVAVGDFNRTLRPWRGTLDYIFINRAVQVQNCQLILNQPAPNSRTLYPSDHFGMMA